MVAISIQHPIKRHEQAALLPWETNMLILTARLCGYFLPGGASQTETPSHRNRLRKRHYSLTGSRNVLEYHQIHFTLSPRWCWFLSGQLSVIWVSLNEEAGLIMYWPEVNFPLTSSEYMFSPTSWFGHDWIKERWATLNNQIETRCKEAKFVYLAHETRSLLIVAFFI